jgi:mannose-6-phosphate isomerase-like protein (cupin superfamily)
MPKPVDIDRSLATVREHWSPKVIGRVNDQYVKVAKLHGSLMWHKHDDEDELFWVILGKLRIELEGQDPVSIGAGEFFVVPKGVMHNPVADEECHIVLIETVSTKHTGDVVSERTRSIEEQLS